MGAAELLCDLTRRGFVLTAEGNGVRVAPASQLSPESRLAIKTHRDELLKLLSARQPRHIDVAEANRLLADVRQGVAAVGQEHQTGGAVPEALARVLSDAVAIADDHVRNGNLELLRTLPALVRSYGENWKMIVTRKVSG